MMFKQILFSALWLVAILIFQTTVLRFIPFFSEVKPDLAMIVLIFISSQRGSMVGQTTGFIAGLIEDFLSIAPLGLNAFIKTLTGFLFGLGKGSVYYDPIFIPVLMTFFCTLLKAVMIFLLSWVFNLRIAFTEIFNFHLAIELLYNLIMAPVLFGLFNFIRQKFGRPGREFNG